MKLDRFYPIFDDSSWLKRLLPLGIKLVQLRVKDKSVDNVREQLINAKELCETYDATLIVNDYWELAIELRCDWVHLGQEDLDDADVGALKKRGIKLGLSTHDQDELDRALTFDPEYIALGPVYPTILKKMKWHEQGLPRVTEWKKYIKGIPLVAIGGMTVERTAKVFEAGADIISVVTDITLNKSPEARVKSWIDATR
tara:strand:+ start:552 stop:1148 length:597 start_codon:yes stop_codon:yes gene_type:complete